jgi:hypothetical protein
MTKTIVYIKHCAEEVYIDCSKQSYWYWHQTHELRRDPSVSVEDFYRWVD